VQRAFEVLYLDERLRVGRFQPEDGREPQLFVFRRTGAAGAEAEEEEAEVQHCMPSGRSSVVSAALFSVRMCRWGAPLLFLLQLSSAHVSSARVSTELKYVRAHTAKYAYCRAATP
jgi:hypothetical protein